MPVKIKILSPNRPQKACSHNHYVFSLSHYSNTHMLFHIIKRSAQTAAVSQFGSTVLFLRECSALVGRWGKWGKWGTEPLQ